MSRTIYTNGVDTFETFVSLLANENEHAEEKPIFVDYDTDRFHRVLDYYQATPEQQIVLLRNDTFLHVDLLRVEDAIGCTFLTISARGTLLYLGIDSARKVPLLDKWLDFEAKQRKSDDKKFLDISDTDARKLVTSLRNPLVSSLSDLRLSLLQMLQFPFALKEQMVTSIAIAEQDLLEQCCAVKDFTFFAPRHKHYNTYAYIFTIFDPQFIKIDTPFDLVAMTSDGNLNCVAASLAVQFFPKLASNLTKMLPDGKEAMLMRCSIGAIPFFKNFQERRFRHI